MFVNLKAVFALSALANAVTAKPRKLADDSKCFVPGSMSCDDEDDVCDTINGHKYYTVTDIETESTGCKSSCVAESDLEFLLDKKYECGPCYICPNDNRCKVDGKDIKFNLFLIKEDGKCKEKCEKEEKVQEKMDKDGYQCGFCPPEAASASDDDNENLYSTTEVPITPDKCTLKRASHIMRYVPNWPASAKKAAVVDGGGDVYVEVLAHNSGNIYQYSVADIETSKSEFWISEQAEFDDMYDPDMSKEDQGVSVRFVSPRGASGWMECNYSPIAIDLNRDGVITRLLPEDVGREEGWNIDITGDGEEEYLNEWFGPEDGILIDLSGKYELFEEEAAKSQRRIRDVVITGVQLLGDQGGQYADGFAKLKKRDVDDNGVLEGLELVGLHIWTDANSNARLDAGELTNLVDHRIAGLRVTHNGMKSTAILANGREILMEDLWLKR